MNDAVSYRANSSKMSSMTRTLFLRVICRRRAGNLLSAAYMGELGKVRKSAELVASIAERHWKRDTVKKVLLGGGSSFVLTMESLPQIAQSRRRNLVSRSFHLERSLAYSLAKKLSISAAQMALSKTLTKT